MYQINNMCLKSDNNTVKTIATKGVNSLYYVLGANCGVMCTMHGSHLNNVINIWNERCVTDKEIIRICEQVSEVRE